MGAREVGLPDTVGAGGLPDRVTIWEVGPRDGLQNESEVVPVGTKLAITASNPSITLVRKS